MLSWRLIATWVPRASGVLLVVPLLLTAAPVDAQEITGRVVNAQAGIPLASVQIFIPELNIGALSQADGRYQLQNLPAGTHTVSAVRIGYQTVTVEVRVGAQETVLQDFRLLVEPLRLDEVIVTGTAGGTQRRAIGNVVERINLETVLAANEGAISSIEDVLRTRVPGLNFIPPSGTAGGGAQIRLRGSSSVAIAGDPLIYVNGVRMNADRGRVSRYDAVSRLNDIDPRDIESIEVIKGPAAATLYGTEAANGVIQIITKQGVTGAPRFDMGVEFGASWLPMYMINTHYAPDPVKCPMLPCNSIDDLLAVNLVETEAALGNKIFDYGIAKRYNLSVRGGTDLIQYYLSANMKDQGGVVDWNWDERRSLQTSLTITPLESLTLRLNSQHTIGEYSSTRHFYAGNFGWGSRIHTLFNDHPNRGYGFPAAEFMSDVETDITDRERALWSFEARWAPLDWLTHRFVAGFDRYTDENTFNIPADPNGRFNGRRGRIGWRRIITSDEPVTTVDFSGTASFRLTENLGSETSYGGQYYKRSFQTIQSQGEGFANRSLSTLGAAATTTSSETFEQNTQVGAYLQQRFDWDDRIYLTAAIRADDNSAFGTNYDAAIYPKFSGTWVMSEEPFFENVDFLDQLRIRGAWGAAGQQPNTFAATRLYSPVTGPNQLPALVPKTFGNADLGPERGEELELGFDAELFGRLSVNFTRYWRSTKDALVTRTVAPSLGVPGVAGSTTGPTQLVNIGEIRAWGTETSVGLDVLRTDPLRWNLNINFTTAGTRIEDLGGAERLQVQRGRAHVEGFPIASIVEFKVVSADFVSGDRGAVTNLMCDGGTGRNGIEQGGSPVPCSEAPRVFYGQSEPSWILSFNSVLNVLSDWTFSATVDAMGGHWMASDYIYGRHNAWEVSPMAFLQDNPIGQAYNQLARTGLTNHRAGFAKLRELSVRYALPDRFVQRISAESASISLGARNVWRIWLQQLCPEAEPRTCADDPEMNRPTENFFGEPSGSFPPLSQMTLSMRVSF